MFSAAVASVTSDQQGHYVVVLENGRVFMGGVRKGGEIEWEETNRVPGADNTIGTRSGDS